MPAVVVLGGRNLGGALVDRFLADGWQAATLSLGEQTAAASRERGARGYTADIRDRASLGAALDRATDELGQLDVVVHAASLAPAPGDGRFGGGPVADSDADALRRWTVPALEATASFLAEGARVLRERPDGGALIQICSGAARRPVVGQGLWAAANAGIRSLAHTAGQELRLEGIRVSVLVVDGPIESPKTAGRLVDGAVQLDESLDQGRVAEAVVGLAGQDPRAMTYELVLTANGRTWP